MSAEAPPQTPLGSLQPLAGFKGACFLRGGRGERVGRGGREGEEGREGRGWEVWEWKGTTPIRKNLATGLVVRVLYGTTTKVNGKA